MSENKKYYYLKLPENYFEKDEIKIMEAYDNGHIYSLILLKLHLKALKGDGCLMISSERMIPYSPNQVDLLASVINHDADHVRRAIQLACDLGLITIIKNESFWISDMQNFIGKSSTEADRIRKYRNNLDNSVQNPYKCTPELELEIELDIEKDKRNVHQKTDAPVRFDFQSVWKRYPNRVGKKASIRHFNSTVKTKQDFDNINKALDNYLQSEKVKKGFIQNGSTWFNDWESWVDMVEVKKEDIGKSEKDLEVQEYWENLKKRSVNGYGKRNGQSIGNVT